VNKTMRKLAEILAQKKLIETYCNVFNFSDPVISYFAGDEGLTFVVKNHGAEAFYSEYLETLLSEKFDCTINVMIHNDIKEHLKVLVEENLTSFDNVSKIGEIFQQPFDDIVIPDREDDAITLLQIEKLKPTIIGIFKAKALPSPYEEAETKKLAEPPSSKKHKASQLDSREADKDKATLKPAIGKPFTDEEKESNSQQLFKKKRVDLTDKRPTSHSSPSLKNKS
jgi:hypothetical protein